MQDIKEQLKKIKESKVLFAILCTLAVFLIVLAIFFAGMNVGFHQASFVGAWGEHYRENFGFGRPRMPFMGGLNMMDRFPNVNGAVGKIIKIEFPDFVVQDRENTEKIISIADDTEIRQRMETLKSSDMKVNDFVVVIGSPDEKGKIKAKLIRLIPSPEFLK